MTEQVQRGPLGRDDVAHRPAHGHHDLSGLYPGPVGEHQIDPQPTGADHLEDIGRHRQPG
jgi:hypothetical protein